MKATVLVIDDDETIRHFLPRELRAEGYQVLTADCGKAGLQILEKEPADLVLLAMGFVSPLQTLLDELGVHKDARGNARADTEGPKAYATSVPKVFAAGDMRRGQSLVVWAIREGRQCARAVDEFLMGFSELPR